MQRLLRNLPRALACALLLAAAPLQAAIRVDIDGVDAELKRNVEAFLSVERYKDRDKMEEDTVVRLYNRIDEEVRSALKPLGYYEPQMHSTYESSKNDKDWRIRITIEPGKPVIIESAEVGIEGPGKDDPVFRQVRDRDTLRKGVRLNHGNYEQAKGDLQRIAAAYGYLDAKLLENQMKVDPAAHRADIRLRLDTGPRYHFGEIRIEQSVIRPELMRRFMRFKEGDPFSAALLLRTQFALDDSQYFSTLEVLPQDRDPATLSVPVSITAKQNRQSFSLGGGYGTDTGLRGTFGWTDPRINDLGHRFRVEVQASNITRRIDARYDVPMGDPAVERMSLLATDRKDQTADLETTELSLTPSVTQVQGGWQRVFSLGVVHTQTDDGATLQSQNLLVPGISYASVPEGYLGETLFSRAFQADLIGSIHALGSDADFLRLHVQGERVFNLQPKWHLLLRGELGASLTRNFDRLPGIYRFFAGGDRSVRGFAYDALSPVESVVLRGQTTPSERNIGGRDLLVGSVEVVRDLPRNFAIATFFDIGNAFDKFGDPLAYAAGVGVRYRLPVVSIGLDIAQPLSQSGGPRLNLNISPKL
jgi:translocation and assembly module TamA